MAPRFSFPAEQRFECKDCPARCCRLPWSIRFDDAEAKRYLEEPFVRERAGTEGLAVIALGVLPMHDRGGRLECIFLDEDELCSLQKRFGHGYIPRSCQTFPFGFVRDEKDVLVAQLSLLCPSIRDNYGRPVGKQLAAKLEQRGGAQRMSQRMGTRDAHMLTRPQYLRVARHWDDELARDGSPAATLAQLFGWTMAFEETLVGGPEVATDVEVAAGFERAAAAPIAPFAPRSSTSYHGRVLYAYLLGNLCRPSRLRQPNRVGREPWRRLEGLRAVANKLAWMLERGSVDLLFVPRRVPLRGVRRVARFLDGAEGVRVRNYLRRALALRQLFAQPRHQLDVLLDLALATAIISRYARCRAASEERGDVSATDVGEAIGVAELVLLSHAAPAEQPRHVRNLRRLLLLKPARVLAILASEA